MSHKKWEKKDLSEENRIKHDRICSNKAEEGEAAGVINSFIWSVSAAVNKKKRKENEPLICKTLKNRGGMLNNC